MNGCICCKACQRGLTLVELMISIVISLVILGGVVQSVITSKTTYTLQEEMARMQENSRFALDLLASEIRMAGYNGCGGSAKVTNTLNNSSAWYGDYSAVRGLEGEVDTFHSDITDPYSDQDAIYVLRGDTDNHLKVKDYNPTSAVIDVEETHSIPAGTLMIIADASCKSVGIFQSTGNNTTKIGHNPGGSVSPGNCTKNLTFGGTCSDPFSGSGEEYGPGSSIMTMSTRVFFISKNGSGIPSLYMKSLVTNSSSNFVDAKEELVEGVEGMQLTYGVDFDSNGEVDRFQSADSIAGWAFVKSVRVQLLMRSINSVGGDNISVEFNGKNYTDKYIRQVASSTVMLRNR